MTYVFFITEYKLLLIKLQANAVMKKMCYALGNYGLTSSITNSKETSPILSNSLRVSKNIIQILKQNPNQCQIQGLSLKSHLHLRRNFNIPAMFMFSLQTSPPLSVYKQCFTRVFRFEKLKDKMFSVVFPDFIFSWSTKV